jgi:hypothetical protein
MTVAFSPATRFRVSPHVHVRAFGEELVVLDVHAGAYFSLNELGARLWHELAGGCSLREVTLRVAPDYDVELERLASDLTDLTSDLVAHGLLTIPAG